WESKQQDKKQPMTLSREARLLEQTDKARQIPERHGVRRGEAVFDFAGRQRGRQTEFGERLRRLVRHPANAVLDQPIALFQSCCSRIDARGEAGYIVEEQQSYRIQNQLTRSKRQAMDDNLVAGLVALAQP